MKGERIIMLMLAALIILLIISFFAFLQVRMDIAKINKAQIEDCYVLDCALTPFGVVNCHQVGLSNVSDVSGLVKMNGSVLWQTETGK